MSSPTDTLCARVGQAQDLAAAARRSLAAVSDLVALVTDLRAALEQAQAAALLLDESYRQVQRDRDEARKERDAARAEVASLRGQVEAPAVAGGRELVWVGVSDGTWHLCWVDDRRWATAPYSAWRRDAVSYACFGAPRAATVQCNDIRAAVCELARMARADGRTVPPHPEGWDVGVDDG